MWNLWICRADWVVSFWFFSFSISYLGHHSMFLCFLSKMFFSNSFSTFDIFLLFPSLLLRNAFVCYVLSHFSRVWLHYPMNCSPSGSSLHGVLQTRILEWAAMPLSRGSFWPRIEPSSLTSPALAGGLFNHLRLWLFYSVSKIYNFSNNTSQSSDKKHYM